MKKMKYIIVDNGQWDAPVIFDEFTQHFTVAANTPGEVISAGYVQFMPTGLECYGESISLGIKARPEIDSKMINKMLGVPDV